MPLSTEDHELIARLLASGRIPNQDYENIEGVYFFVQRNFTIALVVGANGYRLVGAAKRNCYDDDPNDRRGKDIALTRALRGDAVPIP